MGLVLLKILQNERNSISKLARKFGMLIVQPWLYAKTREKKNELTSLLPVPILQKLKKVQLFSSHNALYQKTH